MTGARAQIAARLARFSHAIGRMAALLILLMLLLETLVVLLRYFGRFGSVSLQESVFYLHGAVFLLSFSWIIAQDRHIRVDVFYARFSQAMQRRIEIFTALFIIIPLGLMIAGLSLPYVLRSFTMLEGARDPGGLPLVFLLKTMLPISGVMMALQGLVQVFLPLLSPLRDDATATLNSAHERAF